MLLAPIILLILASAHASAAASRDELRLLMEYCLDPVRAGDGTRCPAPVDDNDTSDEARCKATTHIWAKSAEFVAIRDRKMCGCPPWFEHGIVMPFAPVAGVESDNTPEGIWQFAWDVAAKRIDHPDAIALAVNSRLQRSQDQLHVHIVQLLEGARERFPDGSSLTVDDLKHVWAAARALAQAKNMQDSGVLLVNGPGDKLTVLVTDGAWAHSPEKEYTRYRCQ